jgi:hypothetical protein
VSVFDLRGARRLAPHPRRPYQRRVRSEDAADDDSLGEHAVILARSSALAESSMRVFQVAIAERHRRIIGGNRAKYADPNLGEYG